jgi:hypothetical protein
MLLGMIGQLFAGVGHLGFLYFVVYELLVKQLEEYPSEGLDDRGARIGDDLEQMKLVANRWWRGVAISLAIIAIGVFLMFIFHFPGVSGTEMMGDGR